VTKRILAILAGVAAVTAPLCSGAFETTGHIEFLPAALEISQLEQYHKVRLSGCELSHEVGRPQLPIRSILLVIPPSAAVEKVEVVSLESEVLDGDYLIFPAQPPQILPMVGVQDGPIEFTGPEPSVYESDRAYPPQLAGESRTGNYLGYRVVGLTLHPVQYVPSEGRLVLHKRMAVRVESTISPASLALPVKRSDATLKQSLAIVQNAVLNPQDAVLHRPSFEPVATVLPPDDFEYVIITSAEYDSVFERLAAWKTKKGVPACVTTTEWINGSYSGWDEAEKIRNFVRDAHASWGAMWILLGGDVSIVPDRVAFAMECQAGFYPDEDSIRADHYYSDLDGTWDRNGNHIYGEVADSVDLYADVFVGRAPAENLTEVQTFVEKVLIYERSPIPDYQREIGFFAEILWSSPYTDAAVFKDMIDDASVPDILNITKLYERDGNETKQSVIAAINAGQNVINHAGHCAYTVMSVGTGSLFRQDMDTLSNGNRLGLMYSIGCWPAAFDYDCVAEHFLNNPGGGGVAFVGNSRYGWGSPGNPGYGFSDMFDIEFFNQLYGESIVKTGAALAATKAAYASRSHVENVYRWHQYQLNVLGDPELSIWTDSLRLLMVHFPDSLPVGTSPVLVTVSDGAVPVSGALVCLMKEDEVYERSITNSAGQVSFGLSPATPGNIQITATARDYLPYEDSATIFAAGPFVKYLGGTPVDTSGNADGVCNPGEEIWLPAFVKNHGSQTASLVDGIITTSDPFLTLDQTSASFGDIPAGDSSLGWPDFEFTISSACTNGHVAYLDLAMSDSAGHSWSDIVAVTVCLPALSCPGYSVRDTTGNDNGVPEPGETITLLVHIKNSGLGDARGVQANLRCSDPHVTLPGSLAAAGDIEAGGYGWGRFTVSIDSACAAPHFPSLMLDITTSESQQYSDSLLFAIGTLGFEDDVEDGTGDWTPEGAWHITEHNSHSPSHSWYCGQEGTWQYDNQMNVSLTGPWFVLGPGSYLSFWHWYDMPIYGSDGLYIEISTGSGWDTLDFKGCGGALDSLLPGRMWFNEWYDLSSYRTGDSARIRFRFYSDSEDVGEGWYIDDIDVGAECTGVEDDRMRVGPRSPRLYQNKPNPFTAATTVYAYNPGESRLSLEIYDLAGRLVSTLPMLSSGSGLVAVTWDGTTSEGNRSTSGTYFYRLTPSLGTAPRKMIYLR
jgi:hypothetical protein